MTFIEAETSDLCSSRALLAGVGFSLGSDASLPPRALSVLAPTGSAFWDGGRFGFLILGPGEVYL